MSFNKRRDGQIKYWASLSPERRQELAVARRREWQRQRQLNRMRAGTLLPVHAINAAIDCVVDEDFDNAF